MKTYEEYKANSTEDLKGYLKKGFTPRGVTKAVVSGVVGAGTSMILKDVIDHNVCHEEVFSNRKKRLMYKAARGAMAGATAQKMRAYTDKQVDGVFDALEGAFKVVEEVKVTVKTQSYENEYTVKGEAVKNDDQA